MVMIAAKLIARFMSIFSREKHQEGAGRAAVRVILRVA
ncbi:hypothetical protein AC519_3156 [Pseudomonas savastanoi]|nr:hypothetical protein AC519_3156 [Pseudomonas savastanoi]